MSEWDHHHHTDDATLVFCFHTECDVSDYEIDPCAGVLWLNDQWSRCHFRLVWREDAVSSDVGEQIVLPTGLAVVPADEEVSR